LIALESSIDIDVVDKGQFAELFGTWKKVAW